MIASKKYRAVVVGSSAGGLNALKTLLRNLDMDFRLPVIIVQHISPDSENYLVHILNDLKRLKVKEADEKERPQPGYAYVAPPNYHLLVEPDLTFTLTVDEAKFIVPQLIIPPPLTAPFPLTVEFVIVAVPSL